MLAALKPRCFYTKLRRVRIIALRWHLARLRPTTPDSSKSSMHGLGILPGFFQDSQETCKQKQAGACRDARVAAKCRAFVTPGHIKSRNMMQAHEEQSEACELGSMSAFALSGKSGSPNPEKHSCILRTLRGNTASAYYVSFM